MLIEFRVKNFRSFKDEQVFTMESEGERGYFKETDFKEYPYLNTISGFYGANGSGKSNIFKAFEAMQEIIIESGGYNPGDSLEYYNFCLSKNTEGAPISFAVKFLQNKVLYSYSFSFNSQYILSEVLQEYNISKNGFDTIFDRYFDFEKKQDVYKDIEKIDEKWHDRTLENMLALSQAPRAKLAKAREIYDWFKDKVCVADGNSFLMDTTLSVAKEDKNKVVELLKKADLGIENFDIQKKDFELPKFMEKYPEEFKERIKLKEGTEVTFFHKSDGTGNNKISLDQQSEGTQRYFGLAGVLIEVLNKGETLCIDEIDERLHPHLLAEIIKLFNNPRTNPNHAQLIFAAHNTYLMEFLEHEQIWFAEKDQTGATSLTSLWEYDIDDFEDFNKNYLLGRYKAVPHIPTLMPYKLNR